MQLLGLLLGLEGDESVALGAAAAVADDLGGLDVAEGGEELVEVGLGGRRADAAHEDPVGHQGPVLDARPVRRVGERGPGVVDVVGDGDVAPGVVHRRRPVHAVHAVRGGRGGRAQQAQVVVQAAVQPVLAAHVVGRQVGVAVGVVRVAEMVGRARRRRGRLQAGGRLERKRRQDDQ